MAGECILCGDIGSGTVRLALISREGETLSAASVAAPPPIGGNGVAEIEPQEWWRAFNDALSSLDMRHQPAAIALCGITRAQVLLDAAGQVVRPAITWADSRADVLAAEWCQREGQGLTEAAQLNGFHPFARLMWLREHEPVHFARISTVLDPKDYLALRLTENATSDPVSLARLIAAREGGLFARAGINASLLPQLHEPWQVMGRVRAELSAALADVPVLVGSNDTWTAVLGLGAMRPGHAYNISGTTETLGLISAHAAEAPGLVSLDWRGVHHLGGPSQNGADVWAWREQVIAPVSEADMVAARSRQPPLFLPYLRGERVPHWDGDLRGAYIGLSRSHGPADLALAVMEGVALQNRLVLSRAEAAVGECAEQVHFGGGGAHSPLWCQIKADILGREIVTMAADEPGLLGAAMLGGVGLGWFADLSAAQQALAKPAARYVPDAARQVHYERLFALYQAADAALKPLSHAFVALAHEPAGVAPAGAT